MASTFRQENLRDYRKERQEDRWSAFFADDDQGEQATWDASVEALLTHRKVSEESDD